jgi:hypothetical protein
MISRSISTLNAILGLGLGLFYYLYFSKGLFPEIPRWGALTIVIGLLTALSIIAWRYDKVAPSKGIRRAWSVEKVVSAARATGDAELVEAVREFAEQRACKKIVIEVSYENADRIRDPLVMASVIRQAIGGGSSPQSGRPN